MAFKSEIHVAELASIRTGHTDGDIYYILDNGMLGDLPCKPGTFVKWHNDTWQIQPDEHYALASAVDGEIAQAINNVLDDGSASETIVVAVPSSQSSDYTVGNYYEVQGKVAKLRTKTEGDNVTELTFDTTSGVLEAINNSTGKVAVFTFSGIEYPLIADMNAALISGKDVVLIRDQNPSRYDVFYLTYRNSGGGHIQMEFTGLEEMLYCTDDTWTVKPNSVAMATSVAPAYDSTQPYPTVGTAVMHKGLRYVSNTAISTAEAWTPAHWTEKSVEDEIGNVEALLAAL
jgi:hypothetical protein